MLFGLTRGEIILIAFIFALVYGAGLLPRLVARLTRGGRPAGEASESDKSGAGSASPDD